MRFSTFAVFGGLATLATAVADHWQMASVMCTGEKTVTVTVTAGIGGGAAVVGGPAVLQTPPPERVQAYTPPAGGSPSSWVSTGGDTVTSVVYNMKTTSTYLPSAGVFPNPYQPGESLTVGKATWKTLEYPRSTVYNYPPGGLNKLATMAVYDGKTVVEIVIIVISIQVVNGRSSSIYSTQTDKPTYTPPPPPPYTSNTGSSSTSSAEAASKTHYVDVGTFNGKVQFVPDIVYAAVGDVVLYNFLAKSHSLTQSEFLTPCTYNGGFDTGLNQPNPNNQTGLFEIPFTVSTTKPLWFYCKQPGPPNHCGAGMVMGINPAGKMDQFIQNAINQNGHLNSATSSAGSSSTTSSTSTTSSSTTSAYSASATVTVGLDDGKTLKFSPPYLNNIGPGSHVHFDFRALNHTLTESSFDHPCSKLAGTTIDTNFMNFNKEDVSNFAPFDLLVTGQTPRYFYCKQANGTPNSHCGKGMVFALNIDQGRFNQFQLNAEATLAQAKGKRFIQA